MNQHVLYGKSKVLQIYIHKYIHINSVQQNISDNRSKTFSHH